MTHHNQGLGMHLLSGLALLFFSFLAMASFDLFGGATYLEQPCSEITPVSATYTIVINVKDKVTGEPIPNAEITTMITLQQCIYKGNGKCQVSPGTHSFSQFTETAGQDGKLTLITKEFTFSTSLDYASIDVHAGASHYSTQEVSRELTPDNPYVSIDLRIINLNTQP